MTARALLRMTARALRGLPRLSARERNARTLLLLLLLLRRRLLLLLLLLLLALAA